MSIVLGMATSFVLLSSPTSACQLRFIQTHSRHTAGPSLAMPHHTVPALQCHPASPFPQWCAYSHKPYRSPSSEGHSSHPRGETLFKHPLPSAQLPLLFIPHHATLRQQQPRPTTFSHLSTDKEEDCHSPSTFIDNTPPKVTKKQLCQARICRQSTIGLRRS